jgi:hypothetical protein
MPAANNRRCYEKENRWFHLTKRNGNTTVECICPKCGTHHKMKLQWTGRGRPKKFCQPCKSFITSIEKINAYDLPTDVHKGIEKAV